MNAYELAEQLKLGHWKNTMREEAADMLIQQADRIAELEKEKIKAYDNGYEDGQKANTPPKTYVFDGKQVWDTTPQIKELSDEEILDVANNLKESNETYNINFARAILKKASEK